MMSWQSAVHEPSQEGPHEGPSSEGLSSLRYDPQLRLKVREVFSNVEQLQQAGVIISHAHICSVLKNALNLTLTRDIGVKLLKHFLSRSVSARLSSTNAEDRKVRYDAFAKDIFVELEKGQHTHQYVSIQPPSRRDLDADLDNLPDTTNQEKVQVDSSKKVTGILAPSNHLIRGRMSLWLCANASIRRQVVTRVSLKNWLHESKALGLVALPARQNNYLAGHIPTSGYSQQNSDVPRSLPSGISQAMLAELARLVSYPRGHHESKLDHLRTYLHSAQDDGTLSASAVLLTGAGELHFSDGLEYSKDTPASRPALPETLVQFSRTSSDSCRVATRRAPAGVMEGTASASSNRTTGVQMKEFDVDECFDADSVYHPGRQSTTRSEGGRAATSSSHAEANNASLSGTLDLTPRPSNTTSAACKFEMLRPQEATSDGHSVHINHVQGRHDDERMAALGADHTQSLDSGKRLSVDALLSAVHRSLSAQGQGNDAHTTNRGHAKDPDNSEEKLNEFEEIHMFFASERAKMMSNDMMPDKYIEGSQRMDALTRAEPSTNVSARNFQSKPAAIAPLPKAHVQQVNDEIFAALRQKCHTVTMIFGYLNSRAVHEHNNCRARNNELGASAAKRNSVSKADFKAVILQMGLGLSEGEIAAVYDLNGDVRTGELTFTQLQRAIKGISAPGTPRAVSASKQDNKEPKESDKIREVLKKVWETAAEAFVFFDISGSDHLNMTQLRQGLKRLRLNAISVEVAFQEIDLDRDGRISERDFIRHFAAGWHPLGDFIQMRKAYDNVKAKHRTRVANDFQVYIDALNQEERSKSPLRNRSPLRNNSPLRNAELSPIQSSDIEMSTHFLADVSRPQPQQLDTHGDVEIELVLDMDFAAAMENEAEVRYGIQRDIAFSCDGQFDKVKVSKLRAGPVIAEITLCEGLCSDGRSPQDAVKELQKQVHDQQSSLLLCEYTGCTLDIILKLPEASTRSKHIQTPDSDKESNSAVPISPTIEGLDLHGFDSATHRRSNEPPRETNIRRRPLLDPPSALPREHDRRNHDPDTFDPNAGDDHAYDLVRTTSNETSIPDSDTRSQQNSSFGDDTYDDILQNFHSRSHSSGTRPIRATNPGIREDREDEFRPSRSAMERFPTMEVYDDSAAMTPSKLAALRLQIKRQKEVCCANMCLLHLI
jgi:hypothetical protein